MRAYDVNNVHEQGGDWERAAFVESSGFVLSAVAGTVTIQAGVAIFLAMTPVGWVALIATAAGASLLTNKLSKIGAEKIYDSVSEMSKTQ